MKIQIEKEPILRRIRFENPWWETSIIDEYYSNMKKREYFQIFYSLIKEDKVKRAVVSMGPRRVGKTVLIFHAIQALINEGVAPKNICYFTVETPIFNGIGLHELLDYYFEITGKTKTDKLYVFFDEIQYLKDWEIHLKNLVDVYHNIKFVVSGSAAAALKIKSVESGAGRFTDFALPPLTFYEYLKLLNEDSLVNNLELLQEKRNQNKYAKITYDFSELNKHFVEYINYGGYPEVLLSPAIKADPGRFIKNDIVDKVLLRDLPVLYGIEDIQELNSLFTYIAYHTGCEMSLDSICSSSGVSKNTIKKYITYLEAAFLIQVIHRIDNNSKKFKRANFFKIYLTNPSLRCALFTPLLSNEDFFGNMVETAIYSQWNHSEIDLYYARWNKGEIDIVLLNNLQKPQWVTEIKWSNSTLKSEEDKNIKNIVSFYQSNPVEGDAAITTIDKYEIKNIHGIDFKFIPASFLCYMIGANIVKEKNREALEKET